MRHRGERRRRRSECRAELKIGTRDEAFTPCPAIAVAGPASRGSHFKSRFMGISWARPRAHRANILISMVGGSGIEPLTPSMSTERSAGSMERPFTIKPISRKATHLRSRMTSASWIKLSPKAACIVWPIRSEARFRGSLSICA